jgi:hypothetical protein
MARLITALIIGAVFGIGLAIAGMLNPSKVVGFLNFWGLGSVIGICDGRRGPVERHWPPLCDETQSANPMCRLFNADLNQY